MEYPEAAPINGLGGYSLMLPYLVGEDLRWSYGGMKGTAEGRWGLELRDDLPRLVGEAQEVGFCGALLDTASLGEDRQLEDYTTVLGVPDAVSEGQRWVFFEWDDVGTPPVVVTPNGGFSGPESDGADTFWWQVARQGELSVRGLGRSDAWVTLVVGAPPCGPQAVRINGRPHVVRGARQEVRVPVKRDSAGVAGIEVIGSGDPCRVAGDSRPLRPRVFQVRQVDGLESASTSP
jgi:hypothetical protein